MLASNLEEVEKLNTLIDDLLVIARYKSGEQETPRDPVRLGDIVSDVVHDLRLMGMARGVQIQLKLDGEQGLIAGDPRSLHLLIRNIIENGIFYTPRGGSGVRHLAIERRQTGIADPRQWNWYSELKTLR